jgi:hypothetical protein
VITISHTHAGTVILGSARGDGVYEIAHRCGFIYTRTAGIHLRNSRDKDANQETIEACAAQLRAAGFEVSIDVDNTPRPAADREQDRHRRAAGRAQRLDKRAEQTAARANTAEAAARRVLDHIPAGQPMLTDHHSYSRDRNTRERALRRDDQARELSRTADAFADRAAAVRAHDAADTPRVITRRIDRLEAEQRRWQRNLDSAGASTGQAWREKAVRQIARLAEQIAHERAKLGDLADTGRFVAWGPHSIARHDVVKVGGSGWFRVTRVNAKTVSLDTDAWPKTIRYDKIFGRRRDGWQCDTPHGEPWPQADAVAVARWARTAQALHDNRPGSDEAQPDAALARRAMRLVHGLPGSACDPEVAAFSPDPDDPDTLADRRRLAVAYTGVYDRLRGGEPPEDIAASITIDPREPAWRMPAGEPVDRHPQQLHPGDIIAGIWDTGAGSRRLRQSFAGPLAHVGDVHDRGRYGQWLRLTLADGTDHDAETVQWLAVHCCPAR